MALELTAVNLSADSIRQRFLILQALRWLPVGFVAPLLVLVLTRKLSLTQAGPLLATYSVTTAVLELPTGVLADAFGRRPVLLLSSLSSVAFYALFLVSSDFAVLAAAMFVGGVSRALDSGPLESWFVDRSRAVDPSVDLRLGLTRAGAVDGAALAVGSIVGGVLPAVFDGRLLVSVAVALAFQVVHLGAILVLMDEQRRPHRAGVAAALAVVAVTAKEGVRTATRDLPVRRLLVGAASIGVALVAFESLWQPRFVDLLDRDDEGTAFLGVLLALGFAGGALGSAVAPRLARVIERRADAPATVVQLAGASALAALAITAWTPLAAGLFVLFYLCNGAAAPLRDELMHEHVPSEQRSTMLSTESLVFQGGAFVAALTMPALADAQGVPIAWLIGGAVLAVGALFYIDVPRRPEAGRR